MTLPPRLVPDRPSDEHDWRCTNCTATFKATDEHWRKGFGRLAPTCPSCKAYSQYTHPIGIAGKLDKLEHMGFQCEGGPLANCIEWQEIRRAAAPPAEAPAERGGLAYATRLANAMWRAHYIDDAPEWEPCPDLMGVLSQIDNMLTGLTLAAAPAAPAEGDGEPVAWAVQLEDGTIGGFGWASMDTYPTVRKIATLREGCSYVFAYRCDSLQAPRVTGGRSE